MPVRSGENRPATPCPRGTTLMVTPGKAGSIPDRLDKGVSVCTCCFSDANSSDFSTPRRLDPTNSDQYGSACTGSATACSSYRLRAPRGMEKRSGVTVDLSLALKQEPGKSFVSQQSRDLIPGISATCRALPRNAASWVCITPMRRTVAQRAGALPTPRSFSELPSAVTISPPLQSQRSSPDGACHGVLGRLHDLEVFSCTSPSSVEGEEDLLQLGELLCVDWLRSLFGVPRICPCR